MTVEVNETELPVSTQINLTKTCRAKNNIAKGDVRHAMKNMQSQQLHIFIDTTNAAKYRDAWEL